MARPIKYSPKAVWPVVLESIANGQSLSSILRQHDFPSYAWAKGQLRGNAELRRQYDQAIEDRADRLAEELIELADETMPDGLDGPGMSAWVQKLRGKPGSPRGYWHHSLLCSQWASWRHRSIGVLERTKRRWA